VEHVVQRQVAQRRQVERVAGHRKLAGLVEQAGGRGVGLEEVEQDDVAAPPGVVAVGAAPGVVERRALRQPAAGRGVAQAGQLVRRDRLLAVGAQHRQPLDRDHPGEAGQIAARRAQVEQVAGDAPAAEDRVELREHQLALTRRGQRRRSRIRAEAIDHDQPGPARGCPHDVLVVRMAGRHRQEVHPPAQVAGRPDRIPVFGHDDARLMGVHDVTHQDAEDRRAPAGQEAAWPGRQRIQAQLQAGHHDQTRTRRDKLFDGGLDDGQVEKVAEFEHGALLTQ